MNTVLEVQEDPETGEYFIILPEDILFRAGINFGDEIEWTISEDNSHAILTKANKDDISK